MTYKIHSRYVSDTYLGIHLRIRISSPTCGLIGALLSAAPWWMRWRSLWRRLGKGEVESCCLPFSVLLQTWRPTRVTKRRIAFYSSLGNRANRTSPWYVSWTYLHCISNVSCVYPARLGRSIQDTCIVMYPWMYPEVSLWRMPSKIHLSCFCILMYLDVLWRRVQDTCNHVSWCILMYPVMYPLWHIGT